MTRHDVTAEAQAMQPTLAAMPSLKLAALTHLALCRPCEVPDADLVVLVGQTVRAGGRG